MVEGRLYLASGSSFFILDGRTGTLLARRELNRNVDVASTPLVTDTEIIFGTATDGLLALDRETLDQKWLFAPCPDIFITLHAQPLSDGRNHSDSERRAGLFRCIGRMFVCGQSPDGSPGVALLDGCTDFRFGERGGQLVVHGRFRGNVSGLASLPK